METEHSLLSAEFLDASYQDGQYVDAARAVRLAIREHGVLTILQNLKTLPGPTRGRLSRSLAHAGHSRLGRLVSLRTGLEAPDTETGRALWSLSEFWPEWRLREYIRPLLEKEEWETPGHPDKRASQALTFLLACRLATSWREFEDAENWLERAESLLPRSLMVAAERGNLLFSSHRLTEAENFLKSTLSASSEKSPGNDLHQRILCLLELSRVLRHASRPDEALELLRREAPAWQSHYPYHEIWQCGLQLENPDVLDFCAASLENILNTAEEVYRDLRVTLDMRRVELRSKWSHDVRRFAIKFEYQKRLNCAPATLSALMGYWGRPSTQSELAREITWEGTDPFIQKRFFQRQGWKTAEATYSWESARVLIDHGIPVALELNAPEYAHLVALCGYDAEAQELILMDPASPVHQRLSDKTLSENYGPFGAKLFLLWPHDAPTPPPDLLLPDQESHLVFFNLRLALRESNQQQAQTHLDRLEQENQWLSGWAGLHFYKTFQDFKKILQNIKTLKDLQPDGISLLLMECAWLRSRGLWDKAHSLLQDAIERFPDHALLLRERSRWHFNFWRLEDSERDLNRACRDTPPQAELAQMRAELRLRQGRIEESLLWFKAAASLEERNESYIMSYIEAARSSGRLHEPAALIRRRTAVDHRLSLTAQVSLLRFELQRGRITTNLAQAEALSRHPDWQDFPDTAPDLAYLLFFWGRYETVQRFLNDLGPRFPIGARVQLESDLAERIGTNAQWEAAVLQLIAAQPDSPETIHKVARFRWWSKGPKAAMDGIQETIQVPDLTPMTAEALGIWLPYDGQTIAINALEVLTSRFPDSHWLAREKALALFRAEQIPQALTVLDELDSVAPNDPAQTSVRAVILWQSGRTEEARLVLHQAWKQRGFQDLWMPLLIELLDAHSREGRSDFNRIGAELLVFPHGQKTLTAYLNLFESLGQHQAYRKFLTDYAAAWPGAPKSLFIHWRSLLTDPNPDESGLKECLGQMTAIFDPVEDTWPEALLLSRILGGRKEEMRIIALGLELHPTWPSLKRRQADLLQADGRLDEATEIRRVLRRRDPTDLGISYILGFGEGLPEDSEEKLRARESCLWLSRESDFSWQEILKTENSPFATEELLDRYARIFEGSPLLKPILQFDLRLQRREIPQAEEILQHMRESSAEDPRVKVREYRLWKVQEQWQTALTRLRGHGGRSYEDSLFRGELTSLLEEDGNEKEQWEILCQSAGQRIRDRELFFIRAWLSRQDPEQRPERIRAYAATALKTRPEIPGVHFLWGQEQAKLDNYDGALRSWNWAYNLNPDYAGPVYESLKLLVDQNRLEDAQTYCSTVMGQGSSWAKFLDGWLLVIRHEAAFRTQRTSGFLRRLQEDKTVWLRKFAEGPAPDPAAVPVLASMFERGFPSVLDLQNLLTELPSGSTARVIQILICGALRMALPPESVAIWDDAGVAALESTFRRFYAAGAPEKPGAKHRLSGSGPLWLRAFLRSLAPVLKNNERVWRLTLDFLWACEAGRLVVMIGEHWINHTPEEPLAHRLFWEFLAAGNFEETSALAKAYPSLVDFKTVKDDYSHNLAAGIWHATKGCFEDLRVLNETLPPVKEGEDKVIQAFLEKVLVFEKNGDWAQFKDHALSWMGIPWARRIVKKLLEGRNNTLGPRLWILFAPLLNTFVRLSRPAKLGVITALCGSLFFLTGGRPIVIVYFVILFAITMFKHRGRE